MNINFSGLRRGLAAVTIAGGLALGAIPALADPVIYDLTSNHCSDPAGCGAPGTIFGNVTLTQNGANVDVDVHLNNPPYTYAQTGSADFQLFKFNDAAITLANITVNQTVAGQTLIADTAGPGAYSGDGTGPFTWGIDCSTCGNGIQTFHDDLIFHVANTTIAALTVSNGTTVFVADIGNSTNGATGPIDATTPHTNVPEPTSLVIFGTMLIALGGISYAMRRRREDEV